MTLAVTKTSVFLFRRSFDFAQDDRLVCQGDIVIPTKTALSSQPKRQCRPDQNDAVIPTAVEGSHDDGSDQDLGFLFRRSFGFAQDERLVCQGDIVIPTKTALSSRP